MHVKKLRLRRFRNLSHQEVEFPERVTLLVGKNGQGKTNLLEAIYLLAHAKSFRGTKPRGLVRWGDQLPSPVAAETQEQAHQEQDRELQDPPVAGCLVQAELETTDGLREISYQVLAGKARISINSKKVVAASSFYGKLRTVLFVPEDLDFVSGMPQRRREFLDRTLAMVDSHFLDSLVAYERARKSRNEVLRAYQEEKKAGTEKNFDLEKKLAVWDELLIENGRIVAKGRQRLKNGIEQEFQSHYALLANSQNIKKNSNEQSNKEQTYYESVRLEYQSKFLERGEILRPERLLELYQVSRLKDLRFLNTTFGVHRDDFVIHFLNAFGERPAKDSASQGQMRSIVLALKLAALSFLGKTSGDLPILLLDDVESELDQFRTSAFYHLLSTLPNQVIITANQVSSAFKNHFDKRRIILIDRGFVGNFSEQ